MKFLPDVPKRVDWTNTAFLFAISLAAITISPIYLWKNGMSWLTASLFLFYMIATGMSITLGYHRLFSHLSFKAKWPVRLFTLVFGACAFENSALNWCSDHRRHHKHVDHDDDPYDITKGFFWAHIGWILFKRIPQQPMDNVQDLRKDKLVMWQYKYDKLIALLVGLVLPALIGYLVAGPKEALACFLIVGILRVFLVQQSTFFINSLCHCIGRQPYSTKCSARDSFIMSLVTYGEGYHNYHHEFQHDYRNGVKAWNFDPTKWAIWVLEKCGMVTGLRRVSKTKIMLAEMKEARRKAEEELARIAESQKDDDWKEAATNAVHELMDRLAKSYAELEHAIAEKAELSKKAYRQWRQETKEVLSGLSAIRRYKLPQLV